MEEAAVVKEASAAPVHLEDETARRRRCVPLRAVAAVSILAVAFGGCFVAGVYLRKGQEHSAYQMSTTQKDKARQTIAHILRTRISKLAWLLKAVICILGPSCQAVADVTNLMNKPDHNEHLSAEKQLTRDDERAHRASTSQPLAFSSVCEYPAYAPSAPCCRAASSCGCAHIYACPPCLSLGMRTHAHTLVSPNHCLWTCVWNIHRCVCGHVSLQWPPSHASTLTCLSRQSPCVDTCPGICLDLCPDICLDMCTDMCTDMCIDIRIDICTWTYV